MKYCLNLGLFSQKALHITCITRSVDCNLTPHNNKLWAKPLHDITGMLLSQHAQYELPPGGQKQTSTCNRHIFSSISIKCDFCGWRFKNHEKGQILPHLAHDGIITRGTPDTCRPDYVITMVTDVLVPNRHQAISNHHADSTLLYDHMSHTAWHKYHVIAIK